MVRTKNLQPARDADNLSGDLPVSWRSEKDDRRGDVVRRDELARWGMLFDLFPLLERDVLEVSLCHNRAKRHHIAQDMSWSKLQRQRAC